FDDYEDVKPSAKSVAIQDFDPFAAVTENDNYKDEKKSRKGLIIAIIVGICIILALLAALGLIACNNGFFGSNPFGASNDSAATATTATAAQGSTSASDATKSTQSTTAAATTAPSTTKSSSSSSDTEKSEAAEYVTVKVVRGYTFEQAKEMLEADGLKISEGRHRPSDEYDEGLIIAQTPGDGHSVEKGTTVIVDISTGPESSPETPATEAPRQSSSSSSSDDNVPFSACKYNTSYLSQSEVKSMSHSELNIAFNEIYARRGRIFTDSSLNEYFRSQSWYTPKYTASEFSQKVVFNDYETKNINLIYNEQHARGYR
ncbi:MAG: YARHG domain-containing protein, partial [Ruminococcus sp.]|nr:YARHG domain-containing protein [Ruminococcus sp.]